MPEMYGFLLRPKWLAFHLLVFALVASMLWLAFWQLRRLDERKAFNSLVSAQIDQTPVALDQLVDGVGPGAPVDRDALEWRQVIVSGTYLPDQVIWFNRSQNGLAGDNVLTPLVEDDGTTVVVNRGFVMLDSDVTPPPTGKVEILARIRVPLERQRGELTDATTAGPVTEVRRIDLTQLARQLPGDVAPVYLDLIDARPAIADTEPVPVPPPTLDEGPHLSYAIQWFIFSTAALVGWVLAIRRSIGTHRAELTAAGAGPALRDCVPSDDVAQPSSTT